MVRRPSAKEVKESTLWPVLKPYLESRLDELRRQNDLNLEEFKTQRLRGRIEELKNMIALDSQAIEMTIADEQI